MIPKLIVTMLMFIGPGAVLAQTEQLPKVSLRNLKHELVSLEKFKGKVVVLNFWATWCPPCRAEMPDLVKRQREWRGKGLQIIGITYPPTNVREVRRFTRSIQVNYPILLGTKKTKALFASTETMPLTIVIDREGKVVARIEGILLPVEFDETIKPLLK